jgi:hypothetical protein
MMNTAPRQNKTLKKTHDISGAVVPTPDANDTLMKFLDQDAGGAYRRQWHRLERGLRLNRLRKFSNDEAERLQLSVEEKTNLYNLLLKSLDRKLLNSKTAVIYDSEKEAITEIKGLVMHRNSDGHVLFQLLDKQKGVTFRRKKSATSTEENKE